MEIQVKKYVRVLPGKVWLNGEVYVESQSPCVDGQAFLSDVYNRTGADYRKFFKMDKLSKLGFLAAELLMEGFDREQPKEDTGILLFNRSSSLDTDEHFQETIRNDADYFPSPAVFVYTLPNIVAGEIAIRHKIHGETAFYVLPDFQSRTVTEVVRETMRAAGLTCALAGWTEAHRDALDAFVMLCENGGDDGLFPLTPENVERVRNEITY
jgi:hypothetical protein